MISVSIVEDDDDLRENLAFLIDGTKGYGCVSAYPDCETALLCIDKDMPDVILMDIGLPGMSGIEGIREIKKMWPAQNIIVLTVHDDDDLVFEALCAGACGYLIKGMSPERLLEAIREAQEGGAPMSAHIARMVVGSFQIESSTPLTQREKEILTHLCKGKSYKMIASALFISEDTVRSHIRHIYQKLHVRSKSEAVVKALRERLVAIHA
jgi:DNA-binding NarL/FixJ family response regulator